MSSPKIWKSMICYGYIAIYKYVGVCEGVWHPLTCIQNLVSVAKAWITPHSLSLGQSAVYQWCTRCLFIVLNTFSSSFISICAIYWNVSLVLIWGDEYIIQLSCFYMRVSVTCWYRVFVKFVSHTKRTRCQQHLLISESLPAQAGLLRI